VRDRGSYEWVPENCPPRWYPTSLVFLGQIRTTIHIGKLHLVLWIVAMTRLFPRVDCRWWPVVGGASRHSWQQGWINVIIKEWRIKRCLGEDVNVGFDGWGVIRVMGFKLLSYRVWYFFLFELTLSICVWQWSCNSLHVSRCWCKWPRGYLELESGQQRSFYMEIFLWIIFLISTMNRFIFVRVERIFEFYLLVLIY